MSDRQPKFKPGDLLVSKPEEWAYDSDARFLILEVTPSNQWDGKKMYKFLRLEMGEIDHDSISYIDKYFRKA